MRRRSVVLALAALLALGTASGAFPCTPEADIRVVPPGLGPDEPIPAEEPAKPGETEAEAQARKARASALWFHPGETVAIVGLPIAALADASPPLVTVRWGAWNENGPIIAQAPLAEDLRWQVRFRLPETMAEGTYLLSASARDANGEIIGNPGTFTLPVSSKPRTGVVSQPQPVTPALVQQPVAQQPAAAPVEQPASAPVQQPAPAQPAPVQAEVPVTDVEVVEPATMRSPGVPYGPADPARRLVPEPSGERVPVAPQPLAPLTRTVVPLGTESIVLPHTHAPVTGAPQFQPAPGVVSAPLAELAAPGQAPGLPVAAPTGADRPATWIVLAFAGLGLLLLGAAGGGLVLARRWPPVAPTDPVEAELQELISEQRVRDEQRISRI